MRSPHVCLWILAFLACVPGFGAAGTRSSRAAAVWGHTHRHPHIDRRLPVVGDEAQRESECRRVLILRLRGGTAGDSEAGPSAGGSGENEPDIGHEISKLKVDKEEEGEEEGEGMERKEDEEADIVEAAKKIIDITKGMNERLDAEGDIGYVGGDEVTMPMDMDTDSVVSDPGHAELLPEDREGGAEEEGEEEKEEEEEEETLTEEEDEEEKEEDAEARARMKGLTDEEIEELYGGKEMRRYRKDIRKVMKQFDMEPFDKPQLEGEEKREVDEIEKRVGEMDEFGAVWGLGFRV
jgi:hypothetical protein